MTDRAELLDYWLGRCYKAQVLEHNLSRVMPLFKERLAADGALAEAARQRQSALTGDVTQRCFISRMHAEFLKDALSVS